MPGCGVGPCLALLCLGIQRQHASAQQRCTGLRCAAKSRQSGDVLNSLQDGCSPLRCSALTADERASEAHDGVFYVHGFRHRLEHVHHARLLLSAKEHPMVGTSRLILFNDNPKISAVELDGYYAAVYPRARRSIIRPGLWARGSQWGRNCGHLLSLNFTRDMWVHASFVVFCHPNVMLFPKAIVSLSDQLTMHPDGALFVLNFSQPDHFKTDLFMFRPRLLPSTAFGPTMCKPWPTFPEASLWQHAAEMGAPTVVMHSWSGSPLNTYGNRGSIQPGGWWHTHDWGRPQLGRPQKACLDRATSKDHDTPCVYNASST